MASRLIIVDISSFIFRAFYAIRTLHSPAGVPVNAVHGVHSMLLKLLSKYRPTHVLLARDLSGGSFRNTLYSEYKANRSAPPEDLVPQFDLIKKLIEHMGLPNVAVQNYEADDLIGSACIQWGDKFDEIYIASGDKDLMQFIGGNVKMLDTMKDVLYDTEGVFEKMGVYPEQIVDYLSMVGDASDNIPGMKGIGAKGAAKLLAEHKTLEKCIEVKETFKGKKLINAFENHIEDALLSKKLTQIVTDIDLGMSAEDTAFKFYPSNEHIQYLKDLGFKSIIKKLEDMKYAEHQAENSENEIQNISTEKVILDFNLKMVDDDEKYQVFLEELINIKALTVDSHYDSDDILLKKLIGLGLSFDGKSGCYISMKEETLKELLQGLYFNKNIHLYCEHPKKDLSYMGNPETAANIFDIGQAHFVVDAGGRHGLDQLTQSYLDMTLPILEKGVSLSETAVEEAVSFVGIRACSIYLLACELKKELVTKEVSAIYEDLDGKLTPILSMMETSGVLINPGFFKEY